MIKSKKIDDILNILEDNSAIEVVSFGLAPNPFGFCYELDDCLPSPDPRVLSSLDSLLSGLSELEERELVKILF